MVRMFPVISSWGRGGGKRIINMFPLFGNWNILRPHLNALSIYKIGPKFAAGI